MQAGEVNAGSDPEDRLRPAVLCAAALATVLTWLFGLRLVEDQDILWHVLTGRWVIDHGVPPRTDPFGSATGGSPWLCVSWLADVLWATGERVLSLEGLQVALAAVPAACVAWTAFRARRRSGALLGAVLFTLACWSRFLPRPDVLSVPLTLALVATLRNDRTDWRMRSLKLLVLAAVWANIHGSFVLVPAAAMAWMAGGWIASRDRPGKEDLIPCAAALLGTCVNPWGPGLYTLFAPYLQSLRANLGAADAAGSLGIIEWKPTWMMLRDPGFPVLALAALALLSLACVLLSGRGGLGPRLALWCLFAGLAWTAVRHVLPFGAVALALLAEPQPAQEGAWWRLGALPVRLTEAAVTLIATGVAGFSVLTGSYFTARDLVTRTGVGLHPDRVPVATAAWMRDHDLPGVTLNNFDSGTYLLFETRGAFRPFLDNRMVSPALVREAGEALSSPATFEAFAARHGVRSIVLSHPSAETAAVIPWLVADRGWQAVFLDATGTVFVRAGAAVTGRAPVVPARRPPGWAAALNRGFDSLRRHALPAADLNLAYLAVMIGDRTTAEAALQRVLAVDPGNAFARTTLAHLPPGSPPPVSLAPVAPGTPAPGPP
jgi:hypothetical protein